LFRIFRPPETRPCPGQAELGSFCTKYWNSGVPGRGKLASFRTIRPREPETAGLFRIRNPQSRNWLCFAQLALLMCCPPDVPSCPSLASFCTFGPWRPAGLPQIGFVSHNSPRPSSARPRPTRHRGLECWKDRIVECWDILCAGNWVCLDSRPWRRPRGRRQRTGGRRLPPDSRGPRSTGN
jgi:hypothetical protein